MHSYGGVVALALLFVASAAEAHVRVQPTESRAGTEQTYTVRVPTEVDFATTSVELEIPLGVIVLSVEGGAEAKQVGGRIISLIWQTNIPPGESQSFVFVATNPAQGRELSWKAHQHYADGSVINWIDGPGTRRPASITKLLP